MAKTKNDFHYVGCNSYTLQCGMWLWNRDSKFTKWQHPAMWYMALGWHAIEFAQNVRHIGILHLVSVSTTSPQSACHSAPISEILSKSDHPRKNEKSAFFAFWRQDPKWQISVILDFRGPIIGSLKSPCTTSYRSSSRDHISKSPSFGENRVFVFWRQTDRQTDGQHRCTKPLSLSRATA